MYTKKVTFCAQDILSPAFAAAMSHEASKYEAKIYLEKGKTSLCVDSLISILALNLQKGTQATISAEGEDAEKACEMIAAMMETPQA